METEPLSGDRMLCERLIDGVAAFAELQDRFRRKLELHLLGSCGKHDGRSREKSVEIASQVLSDCFARSPSLLEKWQGRDNLEAFLKIVAHNRLKTWWDSRDAATEVNSESRALSEANHPQPLSTVDWEELGVAGEALRAGISAATTGCPEGLVFLRLKGLHGVDQRALSAAWGHHEAQTSRRIKEAMSLIRSTAQRVLEERETDFSLLQSALQGDPSILLGDGGEMPEASDIDSLRRLAEGNADSATRAGATGLMCRNARALEYFARLMNRLSPADAVVIRNPALEGVGARIADCMKRSAEILHPAEIRKLVTPVSAGLFEDTLREIGADGGTLWLLDPGEAVLEAVFNPLEPEITGKRQPLVSGIISLVLATSESMRVDHVESHHRHSAAIDSALGRSTRSLIAVPFSWVHSTRGVLTAVRFGSEPFPPEALEKLGRRSGEISLLLEQSLMAEILS